MPLSRRSLSGLVTLLAISLPWLTSCGEQDDASDGETLTADDGTLVFVSSPTDDGMQALTEGPLQVTNGCLGIGDVTVLWPSGTSIADQQPLAIDIPGIGTTRVGRTVSIGGGFVYEPTSDEPPDEQLIDIGGTDVPPRCLSRRLFLANAG